MTKREFYVGVIKDMGIESECGAFAAAEIEKMDAYNEARKSRQTESQKETAELMTRIVPTLEKGVVYTIAGIATEFGASKQRVGAIMQKLVKEGKMTQTEVKIKANKAEGITGGKVKGYSLAETPETTETSEG